MHRLNAIQSALFLSQILASGSLHSSGLGQGPRLSFVNSDSQNLGVESLSVTASSIQNNLLLSLAEPDSEVELGLIRIGCADHAESSDIDLLSLGTSGAAMEHARIFLQNVDEDIVVGNGFTTDTKIDHGTITLDDTDGAADCLKTTQAWNLDISTELPIRQLFISPVVHSLQGVDETKIDHGVLLIDE